jgi:Zn-dependent peptidase ImmA (M78 family)
LVVVTSERIPIAAGILSWARRTSGYDVAAAAKRLNVKQERLEAWEAGDIQPTVNQLRQLASLYKRPLAVLLLPAPPKDFDALRDFRRTGDQQERRWSPALHAEYKRALTQREVLLEIEEFSPGSLHASHTDFQVHDELSAQAAGQRLRELLGMDMWPSSTWSNPRSLLRAALDATENLGVLVLQTRDVAISEMRGFSISEWPYPVIILNGADFPRPKLFTLLHELCHLARNSGGLCDLHEERRNQRRSEDDRLEHYCNEAAASALMPRTKILAEPEVQQASNWSINKLADVGQRYGASAEALLLRLVSLNVVTWSRYWQLKPKLEAAYAEARQQQQERQRQAEGGPSYFVIKVRNLGRGYVQSVLDAFYSRAISSYDAADYLDVKFNQLPKLQEAVQR